MASSLTSAAGILKRVYGDYVQRQQNLAHRAIDEIAKSSKKYNAGGEGFFGSANMYGNEAVGAINETESFRTADNENYQQFKVIPKVITGPVVFSGLLSKAADSDEEAFATAVVDLLDNTRERLLKDLNRQFFGLGNGLLTTVSGSAVTADTSFSVASAQYLRSNMVVDIYNGGSSVSAGLRLNAVDKFNNKVYVSAAGASLANGYSMYKENIQTSAPSDGKECMGLKGIVDDGTDGSATFENISSSSYLEWKAVRIDASSGNLTSDLMQRIADDVQIFGGDMINTYILHPKQRRKYLDIVVPQKRYMDQKLDGGFQKLSFNGIELWLDPDCQDDTVYALDKKRIEKFEVAPLEMGSHDGSDTFLRQSGKDVYEAYWRSYQNFGTDKRSSLGKIIGLAKPSGVS